jgi:tetratricopeptide (TPR) repeat protein
MRRPRVVLVGVVVGLLAAPSSVVAQHHHGRGHGRGHGASNDARGLFDQGVAFADQQRWAEALDAFQRSLALTPRPSTRFNVAQALLRVGRYRDAVAAFEAHQNAPDADTDAARLADSRRMLAEARGRVVSVTLTEVPDGAEVLVDGAVEAGTGATRTLTLDPGLRRFEVRTSDARSERFELTLSTGTPASRAVTLRAAAAPVVAPTITNAGAVAAFQRGLQSLRAQPPRYDEASEAFHEAANLEPSPGTWRWLAITLRGMQRYTESLAAFNRFLADPGPNATPAQLNEARTAAADARRWLARLDVTIEPRSATLLVDGRVREVSATGLTLDPGEHAIELRAEGHAPIHQTVTLARGGQAVLNLRMEALRGRLVIEPSVANATVLVDGQSAGAGRVGRESAAGEHLVEISAPGHESYRRTVRVMAGGVMRVDATLVRRGLPGWVTPVAVAGGILVAGGVATAIVFATRTQDEYSPNWASIAEGIVLR